jgi:hypothetical protein
LRIARKNGAQRDCTAAEWQADGQEQHAHQAGAVTIDDVTPNGFLAAHDEVPVGTNDVAARAL